MTENRNIRDFLEELDPEMLCADGYDDAIIGYSSFAGSFRVVYDMRLMIAIFMKNADCSMEEAREYLSYNCWDSGDGGKSPIYIELVDKEDLGEWNI